MGGIVIRRLGASGSQACGKPPHRARRSGVPRGALLERAGRPTGGRVELLRTQLERRTVERRSVGVLDELRVGPAAFARALAAAWLIAAGSTGAAHAWGLTGHRIVTEEAAARMPAECGAFFEAAAKALSGASLEPDSVLREKDPGEARRHFINLDLLGDPGTVDLPRSLEEATRRFGETKLGETGTLPWRIVELLDDLERAMRGGRAAEITRTAGHLAHYAADLFQPLHLTSNHDGGKTCNHGIHDAFESEMIERRAAAYRKAVARGRTPGEALGDPAGRILEWARANARLVEEILAADTSALLALKRDRKDYFDSMDGMAGPIAERQMSGAAGAVASLWYTAWVRAGRPPLPQERARVQEEVRLRDGLQTSPEVRPAPGRWPLGRLPARPTGPP